MYKLLSIFFFCSLFCQEVLVVGISGGSGSGKSTLAKKLHSAFPEDSVILCQDSYYRDLSHLSSEERDKVNFDHPGALEFALMQEQLSSLKNYETILLPQYDFATHTRKPTYSTIKPKKILIVEGLMVLSEPGIRDLLDIKLFVDTAEDIRLIRRIHRDQTERQRSISSILEQYLETVRPMHLQFVEPSKRFADVIIPEGGENTIAVDLIIAKIENKLLE